MTVPTSDNREQYPGNDSATEFDYAFKIFKADDLTVILTASDDTETTLVRGSDYSVDGVGEESGGTVTYPLSGDPLATGETLTILREIPVVQETDLRNQGRYYPETLEDEFDRSRMIDQQQQEQLGRTLSRTRASDYFDARGRRIADVGNAVEDQDAYTKGQADARFANDVITKTGGEWDAKGDRLGSLGNPQDPDHATTKAYVDGRFDTDVITKTGTHWDAELQQIRNLQTRQPPSSTDAMNFGATSLHVSSVLNNAETPVDGWQRVRWVNTLADLQALPTSELVDGQVVKITTTGRAGDFVVRVGDFSTEVTNDPQSGVWVPFDDNPSGTTIVAKRTIKHGVIFPKMFGAVIDNATDDYTAHNDCFDFSSFSDEVREVQLHVGVAYFSDNPPIQIPADVKVRGACMALSGIRKDGAQFIFDRFVTGSPFKIAPLTDFNLNGKNCIYTRWAPGTDYENDSNPTKSTLFKRILMVGTYDPTSDPDAGSTTIPTRTELEGHGVGLSSVMNYSSNRNQVFFENFGIGLEVIGDTLCKTEGCRFKDCARSIHSERVSWTGSAFGMGADNVYTRNDILDSRRFGGVWFKDSFGDKFHSNYLENLDRGGANSSATALGQNNVSRMSVRFNHFNASLSEQRSEPFYYYSSSRAASLKGDTGGNVTADNYATPFADVNDISIQVLAGFNREYPDNLLYFNNNNWPTGPWANVNVIVPTLGTFSAVNQHMKTDPAGLKSQNEDLWVEDSGGWHLKHVTDDMSVYLTVENPNLSNLFALVFDVDDNATGNGRLFVTITDSDETTSLFSGNAFTGVVSPQVKQLAFTSAILERTKRIRVLLGDSTNCKMFSVRATVPQFLYESDIDINPVSLAPGESSSEFTHTVTGAELGDAVDVGFTLDLQGVQLVSRVSSSDTVSYYFHNPDGNPSGTVNLSNGTVKIRVTKILD